MQLKEDVLDYSAKEALAAIIGRLHEKAPELAALVQASNDEGKYVEKSERIQGKREQQHTFRKATSLTDTEALMNALRVMEAYFLEQPMLWSSLTKDLQETLAIAGPVPAGNDLPLFSRATAAAPSQPLQAAGSVKTARIDFESETQLDRKEAGDVFDIPAEIEALIATQKENLAKIRSLTQFGGNQ